MKRVLITGGTGLIGQALTKKLLENGFEVTILSRSAKSDTNTVKYALWDPAKEFIDSTAFNGVTHIIHLAGAGVAEKRWTNSYKRLLHNSRIKSAELILKNLPENQTIESFISAAGINYYGTITSQKIFVETDPPGTDFLAQLSNDWELAADKFNGKVNRVIKLRTPLVISDKGGALPTIAKPIKMGFGSALGSGKQYVPWVHIEDLVNAYVFALESDIEGAFNVVALEHLTNKNLTQKIANRLNKKLWLPKVPGIVLKIILGQRAAIVLKGSRASGDKISKAGFKYEHQQLDLSLFEL